MKVLTQNQWGKVELCPLADDFQQLLISHSSCTARVSLYGGHVLSWQPKGQQEVFWLSQDAFYQEGKAIRGGIPLCWPWFGAFSCGDGKQGGNHGFARQVHWHVDDVIVQEKNVELIISWEGAQQHELWPYHARVVQRLVFGKEFEQSLSVTNLAEEPIEFTGALHSYFLVGSPESTRISHLDNVLFDCKLNVLTQQNDVLDNCVGPIDRIYYHNESIEIVDRNLARTIVVEPKDTGERVLWNPGKDIAKSMTDIHLDGENQFVCLEAAHTKWQSIAPQSIQTIGQRISIKPLD